MNRRRFLLSSVRLRSTFHRAAEAVRIESRCGGGGTRRCRSVRQCEREIASIDERIYGQFLEHINHSVVDGLFAEQIRGCGFEGEGCKNYWEAFSDRGSVELADVEFQNGKKSVRLRVNGGQAGIRQNRLYVVEGHQYDGSLWIRREQGSRS